MDKELLFKLTGLPGTFDTALPQWFFDKFIEGLRGSGVTLNPCQIFVWYYAPGCVGGRALSVAEMYALAMERGYLVEVESPMTETLQKSQELLSMLINTRDLLCAFHRDHPSTLPEAAGKVLKDGLELIEKIS